MKRKLIIDQPIKLTMLKQKKSYTYRIHIPIEIDQAKDEYFSVIREDGVIELIPSYQYQEWAKGKEIKKAKKQKRLTPSRRKALQLMASVPFCVGGTFTRCIDDVSRQTIYSDLGYLIKEGLAEKKKIDKVSRYFITPAGRREIEK